MDVTRFDATIRSLIAPASRRGMLAALLGGALGLHSLTESMARKKKGKGRKKKKKPASSRQVRTFDTPGLYDYAAPGTGTLTIDVLGAGGGPGGPGGRSADRSDGISIIPGVPGYAGGAGGRGGKVTASFAVTTGEVLRITVGAVGGGGGPGGNGSEYADAVGGPRAEGGNGGIPGYNGSLAGQARAATGAGAGGGAGGGGGTSDVRRGGTLEAQRIISAGGGGLLDEGETNGGAGAYASGSYSGGRGGRGFGPADATLVLGGGSAGQGNVIVTFTAA